MTCFEACEARNKCAENESDLYQYHLGCTAQDCKRNAGICRQLHIHRTCDKQGRECTKRHLKQT